MNNYLKKPFDQHFILHIPWMQRLSIAILLFSFLVYLGNTYRSQNLILDDAYITFRFAQRLADGEGFTWNVGGERVEGYTSLLHVLLIALAMKVGIRPELASLAIGISSVIATVLLLAIILRRQFRLLYPPAAVVVGIYLVDQTTAGLSTNGLETQLFVFLLCAGYAIALAFIESPSWKVAGFLVLAVFLSVLCRPEGVLYGGALYTALGAYVALSARKTLSRATGLSYLLFSGALTVALGLIYATWKYWYFGYLFPNAFYVKSSQISLNGLSHVIKFIMHVATGLAPLILGFCFLVPLENLTAPFRNPKVRAKVLLTLVPSSLALLYYVTITHIVGGGHRFSYPTYFYLLIAAAAFLSVAMRSQLPEQRHWLRVVMTTTVCLSILLTSQETWRTFRLPLVQSPIGEFNQYHFKIARALKATGLESRATVLCDAAGIIPFVSGFNQIDRVGLADNFLSGRQHPTPEEREQYIWSRNIDVYTGYEPPASPSAKGPADDPRMRTPYVTRSLLGRQPPGTMADRILAQDLGLLHKRMRELRDNWYWVGEVAWPGWKTFRLKSFLYVRKDSPHFDVLVSSLKKIVTFEPDRIDPDIIK